MITLLMILYSALGFLAHVTRRWTTEDIRGEGWRNLTRYSIGVSLVFPLATYMFMILDDIKEQALRFMVAYLLAFLPFGTGVAIGYKYDDWRLHNDY